jgi:transposase-like protein
VPKYRTKSTTPEATEPLLSTSEFQQALYQLIREAVRTVLEEVMQQELDEFIQVAAYERSSERLGQRNGYYTRSLNTRVGPLHDLKVPRDRAGNFQTQLFERYERNDPAITEGIAQMFFKGVSQQKVASVLEPLMGVSPSASTVSRVAHDLDSECEAGRTRSLKSHYKVVYFDGEYFPILHQRQSSQTAILVAMGVDVLGEKEVLALRVGGEESLDS